MADAGVFAVARSIWSDEDFADEPYTEREAWIWLVGAAAWRPTRFRWKGRQAITLERGEVCHSVRFMAEKWQWSKSRVDRFIQHLESRDMVRDVSRDGAKVYSIKNYNEFQVVGIPNRDTYGDIARDSSGTAAGQQRDKEETLKHSNIESVVVSAPASKLNLPDWVPLEAWNGFVEMRQRIRAPMTGRAKTLALRDLEALRRRGHDPTEVLDQSTKNSWKGLFEPKANSNGPRHQNERKPTSTDQHLAGMSSIISEIRARREA